MLLDPINPQAVNRKDGYLVIKQIDLTTWRVVESQPTLEKAMEAKNILQNHANKHGAPEIYDIRETLAYTCLGMKND